MTRPKLLAPLLLLLLAPVGQAQAGDGYSRSHHRHVRAVYGASADNGYGVDRAFFPGAGDDAPSGRRVIVAEYTEPYLPRGVLYNVPGSPAFARSAVIRAKY